MPTGRTRRTGLTGSRLAACRALGLLFFGWPALAQRAPVQEEEPPQRTGVFFEEDVDLPALLEICSHALDVKIEFEPDELEGAVHVQVVEGYSPEDLWQLANRELVRRGLVSVQPPGAEALRVVKLADAAKSARIEESLNEARAGYVSIVAPLRSASAEALVPTVQLLLSPAGKVSPVKEQNALILSDLRGHLRQALGVLDALDAPLVEPFVSEVNLEHLPPVAMGALLERIQNARKVVAGRDLVGKVLPLAESGSVLVLAPEEEIPWWLETIHTFDRPEPVTTLHYTPRRFGLAETAQLVGEVVGAGVPAGSFRIVPDRLTGALVVTTTPSLHAEIQALFERLESVDWEPRQPLRTYPIRYRRVSEVLSLLEGLLEAGVLQPTAREAAAEPAGSPAKVQGATAPLAQQPASLAATLPDSQGEGTVTLTADEPTNRLIAFGPPRLLDQLEELIATLDVRHDQILVEVLVVTLNDAQTRDLGVELQAIGMQDDTFLQLASLFGLGSPDPASTTLPPATGAGVTGVVLNPGDFSATVRALETLNQGRTLTIPKVLVTNNQQATLDSVTQSPYASTNASNTVATTSFGGTFDAGSSILVKPQVSNGDRIVLEYTVSLSSFVGDSATPELPPPRLENKLQSVATIPDGYTVVVGGLETEIESEAVSQVPILGDIPLIGELFKTRSKSTSLSRFYVFIRANILRRDGFEDLKYISDRETIAAGVDDGWPLSEPRIIR